MHTGFWCGNLKEKDHLKEISVDSKTKSKNFKVIEGI